jgi:hypothetical protein
MASMASNPFSKHDVKVLAKVQRRADRLDYAFNICGIKLGWGSIMGFIPAVGDLLDFFMAGTVIHQAGKVEGGLEKSVRRKMWLNALFDFFIGFVPFIGDIADVFFHSNRRNAVALERMLEARYQKGLP